MSTLSKYVFDPLKAAVTKLTGDAPALASSDLDKAKGLVDGVIQKLVAQGVSAVLALLPAGAGDVEAEVLDDIILGLQAARLKLPPASQG